MLKKALLPTTVLTLLCTVNHAQATDVFAEVKAAYFRPTSDKFRDVYGSGGIYGVEATCQLWKPVYGWMSADYFYKSGHSTSSGGGSSTKATLVPLAFGLKYLVPYKCTDFYLGLGPTFTYIHFTDHSPFVIRHSSKWGYGAIGKAGALLNFKKHFFLDLFTSYSYLKARFSNTDGGKVLRPRLDLSDWRIGAGLGVRWGGPKQKTTGQEKSRP
ncbi:MAG: hypothetical protein ACHQT8_07575 [Chlamydiales bacterium]